MDQVPHCIFSARRTCLPDPGCVHAPRTLVQFIFQNHSVRSSSWASSWTTVVPHRPRCTLYLQSYSVPDHCLFHYAPTVVRGGPEGRGAPRYGSNCCPWRRMEHEEEPPPSPVEAQEALPRTTPNLCRIVSLRTALTKGTSRS